VRYLHSDIDTIERVEILRGLRAADFDILVGINLLREGLDLPEVSLVCILDADKEGFLRSQTSLIQTAGRAARHVNGEVVLRTSGGNVEAVAVKSPHLLTAKGATYAQSADWGVAEAEGFIRLYGMSSTLWAQVNRKG